MPPPPHNIMSPPPRFFLAALPARGAVRISRLRLHLTFGRSSTFSRDSGFLDRARDPLEGRMLMRSMIARPGEHSARCINDAMAINKPWRSGGNRLFLNSSSILSYHLAYQSRVFVVRVHKLDRSRLLSLSRSSENFVEFEGLTNRHGGIKTNL